jgi:hypothetical protein
MKRASQFLVAIFFTVTLLTLGCKHETQRSFYYWKTVFHLSETENNCLKELNISKLYIRFFDVDVEKASGQVIPVATIRFNDRIPENCEIVPVVYLVNKLLKKTSSKEIPELASKIVKQINNIASANHLVYNELQLDCDWTESTRQKYFELILAIKSNLGNGKIISATIRLHQIKYKEITGLPPVDRGMLMYYNMGKISAEASHNSVFNTTDAAKYIDQLKGYPLPLDVALPAFSWGIHIRNNKVIELLNNMDSSDFGNDSNFKKVDATSFYAIHSFFYHGFYFMENDVVKIEAVSPEQCNIAAQQLKSKLAKPTETVAIFHLDSLIFSRYENKDFEKVFNTYR